MIKEKLFIQSFVLVLLIGTLIQHNLLYGQSSDAVERTKNLMGNYESVNVYAIVKQYTQRGGLEERSWGGGLFATPVSSQSLERNVENELRKNGVVVAETFDPKKSISLIVEIWFMRKYFSNRPNNNLYHWICTVTPRAILPTEYGELNIVLGTHFQNMGGDMGYEEANNGRDGCINTVRQFFIPEWHNARK